MSPSLRFFVVILTFLMMASVALAQPTIVNFDFGAVPVECSSWGFAYEGPVLSCNYPTEQNFDASPGFGWILGGPVAFPGGHNCGLTGPNTLFSPPPFNGLPFNQAVFLQDTGSFVWQAVGGFTAGKYTLSFYLGSRYSSGGYDGNQTVAAVIDGNVIGNWVLTSYTPFTLQTASFTVSTGGNHTVEFMGMRPGDHTAFLSYVTIAPAGQTP